MINSKLSRKRTDIRSTFAWIGRLEKLQKGEDMLFAGIDWADNHHDICVVDGQGKQLTSFRISHDQKGFGNLLDRIRKQSRQKDEIIFSIERSNGLLVDYLLSHGYKVYPVPPQSMESYRKRHVSSGARTDLSDALVLADALRTDHHRFKPVLPDSDLARELKILVQDREALVKHKTRLANQLTICLKEYYPLVLDIFDDPTSPSSLEFIGRYPTAELAQKLSLNQFKGFLRAVRYPVHLRRDKSSEKMYQPIKDGQVQVDRVVVKAKHRLALVLVGQLKPLAHQIKQYDKEIDELFNSHPDCGLFASLPASGQKLAPKLSTIFCEDRERYTSSKGVQCLSGTAPVTEASGKFKRVYMRYACNKNFRHIMHQYAFASINKCLWARAYYDSKRKGGKTHSAALRALGNKWLKIIYTMWKNHTYYNEDLFLAARQKHVLLNAA